MKWLRLDKSVGVNYRGGMLTTDFNQFFLTITSSYANYGMAMVMLVLLYMMVCALIKLVADNIIRIIAVIYNTSQNKD